MKIISGKYKGKNLKGFNIDGTRPTMDRVKESLFAIINNYLENSIVLDLFAGSGNLGFEALSNGSSECYFVDNNKLVAKAIKENITNLKIEEKTNIFLLDYNIALKYFKKSNIKFDIIFLDPPYKKDIVNDIIKTILEYQLLNKNGIIICEIENNNLEEFSNLEIIKEKKYSDKYIIIYKLG